MTKQSRKPKKPTGLDEDTSLSNVIFSCCSDHETKAKKQGKERTAKNKDRKEGQ